VPIWKTSAVWTWVVGLSLFCGTFLLFSRAIPHDFIDLDDGDYVTDNPTVQAGLTEPGLRWALTASVAANWHPLTLLSHMLDCEFFGANAHGHHATSVFLHALNAVLAFLVLRRLTGSLRLSAVSAALFAWHPLRAESVAWIAERKDVLSVGFGLLALWSYAVYAERRRAGTGRAGWYYALTLTWFLLGLLCKPMLVTLPFLLLLLDYWPLQRPGAGPGWLCLEKIPFLALSVGSSIVTYWVQKDAGAMGNTFTLQARLANAAFSVARYLGKFFWPFDLAVGYPFPDRWPPAGVFGATGLVLGITGLAVWQRRRQPWLFVGWFWFLGMLVPVLGLVQAGLQSTPTCRFWVCNWLCFGRQPNSFRRRPCGWPPRWLRSRWDVVWHEPGTSSASGKIQGPCMSIPSRSLRTIIWRAFISAPPSSMSNDLPRRQPSSVKRSS